jgi:ABC-type nitrate/sulfonate/bicarbonate transport system substrate-binding protein
MEPLAFSPSSPVMDNAHAVPTPATLKIGYFSRQPTVVFAQSKGYFAEEGLTVQEFQTPSSPVIFANLKHRQWDIILTQIDNVFNYRYNPSNPVGEGTFDAVAFFGTDWGNGAALMARPAAASCEGIRGQNVIVDSPNSGFSFVLYGVLRNKCGFEPKRPGEATGDYNVVVTGGTPGRRTDLERGYTTIAVGQVGVRVPVVATILNAGHEYRAEAAGMIRMGEVSDAAKPFMGGSGVALRSWLDENPDVAVRFIRAYAKAQAWVLDPANKDEVLAQLRLDSGNELVAQRTYATMITRGDGLIPNLDVDREGLFGTASLRDSFGGFDSAQNMRWLSTPASGVFDLSYWRLAMLASPSASQTH